MDKDKITTILGAIGTTLAILMFVSLLEVARENLLGQSHIYIQPAVTTFNCMIWTAYGFRKKEKFVFWANVPGVFLGIFTVITAFIN